MYPKQFEESLKAVEAARKENIAFEPKRMTADEKDNLLAAYHPDYKKASFQHLKSVRTRASRCLTSFAKCLKLTAVFRRAMLILTM